MPIRDVRFSVRADDDPPRPWLPIQITNPHSERHTFNFGLIDTGSDKCTLPAWFASLIGHDLERGRPGSASGLGGEQDTYFHTTKIDILDDARNILFSTGDILIEYADVPCILLGVENFLETFCLKIDYPKRIFSVYRDRMTISAP